MATTVAALLQRVVPLTLQTIPALRHRLHRSTIYYFQSSLRSSGSLANKPKIFRLGIGGCVSRLSMAVVCLVNLPFQVELERAIETTVTAAVRLVNIEESQPVKNRNLSRQNCSQVNAQCLLFFNRVYSFYGSKKYPVLVYPVIFPV